MAGPRSRIARRRWRWPFVAVLTALLALTTSLAHAQGAWLTLPPMPTARNALASVTAPCPERVSGLEGTCVYALGGNTTETPAPSDKVEAYSPATGRWVTLPHMPTARYSLAATTAPCPRGVGNLTGTCVYTLGGIGTSARQTNTVEAYSPAADAWATLPHMPTARYGLASATAPCPKKSGKAARPARTCVYAFGGNNLPPYDSGGAVGTVEAFDPATGTWTTVRSMPTARYYLGGAKAPCPENVRGLEGTCVYGLGGYVSGGPVNTVEAYSPVTDTWAAVRPLPTARYALAAATAPCPGVFTGSGRTPGDRAAPQRGEQGLGGRSCVYAAGGLNSGGTPLSSTEAYNPEGNLWATLPSMPTARDYPAATAAPCPEPFRRSCVYVLGGGHFLSTAEAFAVESGPSGHGASKG